MAAPIAYFTNLTGASESPAKDSEGRAFLLLTPKEINNLYNIDYTGFKLSDWTRKWNRIMSQ